MRPPLLKRIWSAIKRVLNRYESAITRWGERSLLGQSLQSARIDIDQFTRQELQRKHRYWVANSSLVNRIRNLFIQFSVGVSGLQVVPNSSDEDYNHSRQFSWNRWGRAPEVNTRLTLGQSCIQWAGALFDDGEVFIYLTEDERKRPRTQTIEAHRVRTPTKFRDRERKDIIDGTRITTSGMPISYFVQDEPLDGVISSITSEIFTEIPAAQIIHIFKARRPGQMRGIPEGFSGMNTLHDYEDLHIMEMQVAKNAAAIGNVETNPTGELDSTATRRLKMNLSTQNQVGQVVTKSADQFYKVTLGSQTIALKAGDSLKQFQVDRPSVATQNYWDLLISQICCAYNVPKLLVVPYSLQGTVTRADLDICANAFRANFELIAWALQQVYEWQSQWAIRYDRSMDGKTPDDYLECIIRPPRGPNVDIGYTAKALQLEMQMGVKTIQDVYAEKQEDWRVQLRQIAEAEQFIDQLATEFGITPERISQKVIQQKAGSQSGAPGQDQAVEAALEQGEIA